MWPDVSYIFLNLQQLRLVEIQYNFGLQLSKSLPQNITHTDFSIDNEKI
jgi:hypothetical protein